MKLSLILASVLVGSFAQASETLKTLRCENGALKATVEVSQSAGSAAFVQWSVTSKSTAETTTGSGYLFSHDGLNSFTSTDVFESIEVEGRVLTITNDGQDEVLSCQ